LCDTEAPPVCPHHLIQETYTGTETFAQGLKEQITGELKYDSFSGWKTSSLLYINISSSNIDSISEDALTNLSHIWYLNLSNNKISKIHPGTFRHNRDLWWLLLCRNSIADIDPSPFQNQTTLRHLDISGNKIRSLKADTFKYNRNLVWLSLANNMIADIDPSTFKYQDRLDHLDISGNGILSIKPDTFNFNRRLIWLSLAVNKISDIHNSTFQNQRALHNLDISDNKLTRIHPDTLQYNWYLQWLSVANNNIADIDQQTFRNQTELRHLDMTQNSVSMKPDMLYYNRKLTWLSLAKNNIDVGQPAVANQTTLQHLDLSRNRISVVNSSVCSTLTQLQTLILSDNQLTLFDSQYFSKCRNLQYLSLAGNNISAVDSETFRALEQLHQLDLSSNNIKELSLFYHLAGDRRAYRVSAPTYVNLAGNAIKSFKLVQQSRYENDMSAIKFELKFLDLTSNRLDSLNDMTATWLEQLGVIAKLTGNPWNCNCSALGEAWRKLKHKLTLNCTSPEHLSGRTWDVVGTWCPDRITAVESDTDNSNLNTLSVNDRKGSSYMKTILIVIGVVAGCILVAGAIVLVVLVKKLRDSSDVPQNDNVYGPGSSYEKAPTRPLMELDSTSVCETESIYETVT
jgi:Leucine-rich repeat (LRR) protein